MTLFLRSNIVLVREASQYNNIEKQCLIIIYGYLPRGSFLASFLYPFSPLFPTIFTILISFWIVHNFYFFSASVFYSFPDPSSIVVISIYLIASFSACLFNHLHSTLWSHFKCFLFPFFLMSMFFRSIQK